MTHSVELQELQEHLSDYMKKVVKGDTLLVESDGHAIARIEPVVAWVQRPDPRGFRNLDLKPIPSLPVAPVALLLDDRDRDRSR